MDHQGSPAAASHAATHAATPALYSSRHRHKTPRRGEDEVPAGPLPESPSPAPLGVPLPPFVVSLSSAIEVQPLPSQQPQPWGRKRRSSPTASWWCRSRARARAWPPGRSTCSSPSPCDSATTRPSRSTGYQATLPPSSTRLRRPLTSPSADTSRYYASSIPFAFFFVCFSPN
jgi:hypothetical protein